MKITASRKKDDIENYRTVVNSGQKATTSLKQNQ